MIVPEPSLQRHFLAWNRPWLPQVAAWLAGEWEGGRPLDLSSVLAVVPTRQSGRRLREALAEHAAARGAAVFPPRVNTPDTLLASGADGPDVASRLECLLAWAEVLRSVDLAEVPEVFPVAPTRRDFAWAWRLAENFFSLQTQLTEGGLAFADVAARAGEGFPEAERWRQLGLLENLQVEKLAAFGRRESHAARRAFAQAPRLPAGISRVVVLAAPDPFLLALEVCGEWARRVPVDVVIFAPAGEADAFDDWGRPRANAWAQRVLAVPDFGRRVHLCADPAAEAALAAKAARHYAPTPDGVLALGVADPESLPLLEIGLSRAGLTGYNPEGRRRRGEQLYALLAALARLGREPTFDAVAALARCPDFFACLGRRIGADFSAAGFLRSLDALQAQHLPADLGSARAAVGVSPQFAPAVREPFAIMGELHRSLSRGTFPENAVSALNLIFEGRRFDLAREDDTRAIDSVEAWRETMRECAAARAQFPDVSPADWWDLALRIFGESRRTEEKPDGALDLQGWLELLWEDAPHLVVTGLNDGLVPDAVVGDPFLPETLREKLGLKTNAARFARDAYILQALAASRGVNTEARVENENGLAAGGTADGRLDLLFAKHSAAGDPLRPSRLLLRCEEDDLPERIDFLFREVDAARSNLAWQRAWKLSPRHVPPPTRVSVTGLRSWLACPFRFYLAQVLRMEAVDATKSELDARDFGTLCHGALEAMALAPELRDCTDEKVLRDFLLARFDAITRARFGENLTLPLVVQLESARQRLAKAAAVQARQRSEGWVIERAEWKFSIAVAGLEVRGKIDRFDRHEETGAWRILDYKTSDTAAPPHKTHLRPFRIGDDRLPEWMRVNMGGREHVWADLQLPLYLRALAAEPLGTSEISVGYFNLPKAVGETAVALWTELGEQLLAAAQACADGVAAAIRSGEFWPPAEIDPEHDAFAALFHHGAEESVDASSMVAVESRKAGGGEA